MTLNEELKQYYLENEADFDQEETDNVLEILKGYDGSLNGLSNTDRTLLLRMINDEELYDKFNKYRN